MSDHLTRSGKIFNKSGYNFEKFIKKKEGNISLVWYKAELNYVVCSYNVGMTYNYMNYMIENVSFMYQWDVTPVPKLVTKFARIVTPQSVETIVYYQGMPLNCIKY